MSDPADPGQAGSWTIQGRTDEMLRRGALAHGPKPPFPRNIMIELSNACNHACIFCANPKMTRRRRLIDRELLRSILAQAHQLGAREAGFYTTGDPFVHAEFETFIGDAKRIGFEYTYISTNGALAVPKRSQAAIDAGLDSIKFSINAGSRDTYRAVHGFDDWDKVTANLRFIAEYRKTLSRPLKLAITYVMTEQNKHECDAFKAAFGPLVDDICFCPVDNQRGYMSENEEFVGGDSTTPPIQAPCFMVFSRAHITCEGYLTLCCVDYQNYLSVADLKTMTLLQAWEHPLFVAMRERHLRNDLKGTLCYNCINLTREPMEPIVKAFATRVDFAEQAKQNLEKQRSRFATPVTDPARGGWTRS